MHMSCRREQRFEILIKALGVFALGVEPGGLDALEGFVEVVFLGHGDGYVDVETEWWVGSSEYEVEVAGDVCGYDGLA